MGGWRGENEGGRGNWDRKVTQYIESCSTKVILRGVSSIAVVAGGLLIRYNPFGMSTPTDVLEL